MSWFRNPDLDSSLDIKATTLYLGQPHEVAVVDLGDFSTEGDK